jgi:glycosyltransferase involved in cell wall biosynthesis
MKIGIIGSDGIPARYGGFETFVEQVSPHLIALGHEIVVVGSSLNRTEFMSTCSGIECIYLPISANGVSSIIFDIRSFFKVFHKVDAILMLGVSAGLFFPLFKLLSGYRPLIVNVDGLEARRAKWTGFRKKFLAVSENTAIRCADRVVCDNLGIAQLIGKAHQSKISTIAYGGDHVLTLSQSEVISLLRERFELNQNEYVLSIARIEPENHISLMIEGFLASKLSCYVIVGNFTGTDYGKKLLKQYKGETRLKMINSLYDPRALAALRSGCKIYLHGHSVGGTNPSLVEMLAYSRPVLAFDCVFNRYTLQNSGGYFSSSVDICRMLSESDMFVWILPPEVHEHSSYRWREIAKDYVVVLSD